MEHKLSGWNSEKNRAGEIRTRDLLNPIQAHYQAVLRPVLRSLTIYSLDQLVKKASINSGNSSL
jgi:hypothetical protein